MNALTCPDPTAITVWQNVLPVMSGLLLLTALLALPTLWRARQMRAAPIFATALSVLVVVATAGASIVLWMRIRQTIFYLTFYFPAFPSSCAPADYYYGHFSPPPGFFIAVQHTIAQVAPLEQAAAVDVAVAALAVAAVIVCALRWGRRRAPASVAA